MRVVLHLIRYTALGTCLIDRSFYDWLRGVGPLDSLFIAHVGIMVVLVAAGTLLSNLCMYLAARQGAHQFLQQGRDATGELLKRYAAGDAPVASPQVSSAR